MELHLSEEFWIAADALAGHRMIQSPTQQQVNSFFFLILINYKSIKLGCISKFC